MAKSLFKLKHHEPFVFDGDNGKYEIPPLENLAYDDWKDVAALTGETDIKKLLDAYKAFFLAVCPELASEKIGDNQWLQFGNVYFEAMGE